MQARPIVRRKKTASVTVPTGGLPRKRPASRTDASRDKAALRLEALTHAVRAVNNLRDLDALLDESIGNAVSALGGTRGAILLADREPGVLYCRAGRGLPPGSLGKARTRAGEGITRMVAKTGEAILVQDAGTDARVLPDEFGRAEGLRGVVCAPVRRRGDIMGVIYVAGSGPDRFAAEDARFLTDIGSCLAIAVMETVMGRKISKGMARYQALLKYALLAQEDERKRLARELHDETSQTLGSLTFRLQAALQMAETQRSGDPKLKEVLQKAHNNAVQARREIVKLMMDLRPTLLDDLGMPAAIHRYAKDTLEPKGINVNMESVGSEHRLPAEVEAAFFRVAQGLISNVLKHSHASTVSIRVECGAKSAMLRVEDDGEGFDVATVTEIEPDGRGAGLFTMKERLTLVGGTADIKSSPGHGTRITVSVPVVKGLGDLASEQDKGLDRR